MSRIGAMVDRCSQFTEGEINALRAEALRLGRDGRDPVMALQLQMPKTRVGTPERDKLLDEMFRGNVAQASENFVAMRLLQEGMTSTDDGSMTYRFNGQTYTDQKDRTALDMATRMSTCTGADYCALDDEMVMMCKGMMGICWSSREAYLQDQVFKGDKALLDKTLRFSNEIRAAMVRGDTSIFR